MSFGFAAAGDAGNVLLDDRFVTLAPAVEGELTQGMMLGVSYQVANVNTGAWRYADVTYGGRYRVVYPSEIRDQAPPMVFLSPSGLAAGYFHAFAHLGGPGAWSGFEIGFNARAPGHIHTYATYQAPSPDPLRHWKYAVCTTEGCPLGGDTYGMRLWNADGSLCFDSGTRVVKLVGFATHALGVSSRDKGHYCGYTPWSNQAGRAFLASALSPVNSAVHYYGSGLYYSLRVGIDSPGAGALGVHAGPLDWGTYDFIKNQSSGRFTSGAASVLNATSVLLAKIPAQFPVP